MRFLARFHRQHRRLHREQLPPALSLLHPLARRGDCFFDRFAAHFDAAPAEQNLERSQRPELEIPQLLRDLAETALRRRTSLLRINPFAGSPPQFIRAQFYQYTYSDSAGKAKGIWWKRRLLGLYLPALHLSQQDTGP